MTGIINIEKNDQPSELENTTVRSAVSPTKTTSLFDPSVLRLSQNFSEATGVKKLVTTVPVRKPNKQDFIRVHPDPASLW
jgi:hypothetical protein